MIELEIQNQKLKVLYNDYIGNKSNNHLTISFNFKTNEWENKLKFCLVEINNETHQFQIIEGLVNIPSYIIREKNFKISVCGVNDNEWIITNQIKIKIVESDNTINDSNENPLNDVIVYVLEELNKKLSIEDIDIILDDESDKPLANKTITNALNNKADVNHQHNSSEIDGLIDVDEVEIEIKRSYQTLVTLIRTYGE